MFRATGVGRVAKGDKVKLRFDSVARGQIRFGGGDVVRFL